MVSKEVSQMGILDWFKHKEEDTTERKKPYSFTDEDRQLSYEKRKLKQQLDLELLRLQAARDKLQLQADIEIATQELEELRGDDEEQVAPSGNMEEMLMAAIISKFISNKDNNPITIPTSTSMDNNISNSGTVSFTNEQIKAIWDKLPNNQKKMAKAMSKEQLRTLIIGQIPNIDADSIDRAITLVKT